MGQAVGSGLPLCLFGGLGRISSVGAKADPAFGSQKGRTALTKLKQQLGCAINLAVKGQQAILGEGRRLLQCAFSPAVTNDGYVRNKDYDLKMGQVAYSYAALTSRPVDALFERLSKEFMALSRVLAGVRQLAT